MERDQSGIPVGDLGNNILGLACASAVQTTFIKT